MVAGSTRRELLLGLLRHDKSRTGGRLRCDSCRYMSPYPDLTRIKLLDVVLMQHRKPLQIMMLLQVTMLAHAEQIVVIQAVVSLYTVSITSEQDRDAEPSSLWSCRNVFVGNVLYTCTTDKNIPEIEHL